MSTPVVDEEIRTSLGGGRIGRRKIASIAATFGVDLVAVYVAWRLVRPGESLFWPTGLVVIIMALVATAWHLSLKSRGGWKRHRILSLFVAASCLVPVFWAYFGVLPASVGWNATAAHWIRVSSRDATEGCRVVTSGSVGFLSAPYKVCVNRDGANFIVRFSTIDSSRGYAYVQGPSWFPDQCASELLLAHWWVYYVHAPTDLNCPFGVWMNGGG